VFFYSRLDMSPLNKRLCVAASTLCADALASMFACTLVQEADGAGEERAGAASASARGGTRSARTHAEISAQIIMWACIHSSSSRGADSPLQYDGVGWMQCSCGWLGLGSCIYIFE
jgi:hypothetical protein